MALAEPSKFAAVLALPGVLAFILGIVAENKKVSVSIALLQSLGLFPIAVGKKECHLRGFLLSYFDGGKRMSYKRLLTFLFFEG